MRSPVRPQTFCHSRIHFDDCVLHNTKLIPEILSEFLLSQHCIFFNEFAVEEESLSNRIISTPCLSWQLSCINNLISPTVWKTIRFHTPHTSTSTTWWHSAVQTTLDAFFIRRAAFPPVRTKASSKRTSQRAARMQVGPREVISPVRLEWGNPRPHPNLTQASPCCLGPPEAAIPAAEDTH